MMFGLPLSFNGLALGLLGLATLQDAFVHAQREGEYRCGRQRDAACPYGYHCVKTSRRWVCQKIDYAYTTTVTACHPQYTPGYPDYEPDYPSSRYEPPLEPSYTVPDYEPTYAGGDHEPGYEPTYTPPDYEPTYEPGYEPTYTPPDYDPGYEPTYTPPDYDPGYEPTYTPPDYDPTYTTRDYEPTYTPPDYEPTYTPPDYEPTYTPPDYEPTYTPPDYEPTYEPGYEPTYTPSGYEPGEEPTYTPAPTYSGTSRSGYDTSTSGTAPPSSSYTPVVGVPGRVVARRPIQTLQNEYPDVFNMFILAMVALQDRQEDIDISWYQVSGIHGYPFIPWQYPPDSVVVPGRGYCAHRSRIFNTWHRPYIILLEQLLHEEGVKIAERFAGADREKYLAAAEDIRFPYWDWAADDTESRIPDIVTQQSITVTRPASDGSAEVVQIPNPLYSYRFQEPQAFPGLEGQATTERGPNANALLVATFPGRQAATLDLFTKTDFDTFNDDSENVHDGVHVNIGEDMGSVPTAAFDPVFWLHHCQVDRLVALYQATHPGAYLTPGPRGSATIALPRGGIDDMATPLYPFRHPDDREWTSDDVKDVGSIFEYGYTYPEIPEGLSQSELITFTTERINELYGPDVNAPSFVGNASGVPEAANARLEWSANVLVNADELPGSCRILLYVGDQAGNVSSSAPRLEDLAGVAPVFTGPEGTSDTGVQLNITVPLTPALVEKQVELNPQDTVPNLADRLYWYVEKVGDSNEPIPAGEIGSLQVAVISTVTEYSEDNSELPVKSEPQTYYAPTEGKPGGIDPAAEPPVGEKAPPELDEELSSGNSTSVPSRVRRARLH